MDLTPEDEAGEEEELREERIPRMPVESYSGGRVGRWELFVTDLNNAGRI